MKQYFTIEGMTCGKCVATVTKALTSVPGVTHAEVALSGSAVLESSDALSTETLAGVLGEKYRIQKGRRSPVKVMLAQIQPFRPLIASLFFVMLWATVMTFLSTHQFVHAWMQHFMGGFFLLFGGLKVANLKGFAATYRGYDVLAARIPSWGYVYPFVELGLGILFTAGLWLTFANIATVVLMLVGTVGIVRTLKRKDVRTCACLGSFFSLPLTWVTVAENMLMAAMGMYMLLA